MALPMAAINWHSFFFLLFAAIACGFAVAVVAGQAALLLIRKRRRSLTAEQAALPDRHELVGVDGIEPPTAGV